ncbi:MAG: 30S ribosomal protein S13 [Candidatus Pacebacteria bacterium]|nr:30S ribosomal protein S13 [Candidatus Paceibacterota bacterium]
MRVSGVEIPDNKKVKIALTYIYGVGRTLAIKVLSEVKIDSEKRAKDLSSEEVAKIQNYLENNLKTEGELRQIIKQNIQRLKDIRSYRGNRHSRNLPVRGQSTKRNSRTIRGNVRKTAGSGKRKVELR